jgi:hypothetical protein
VHSGLTCCAVFAEPASRELQVNGKTYLVVCKGTGGLDQWGVLRQTEEHGKWLCATCDLNRYQCDHVGAAGQVGVNTKNMKDQLEGRYQAFMDPTTGCRRLTCRSTDAIPKDVADTVHAVKYRGMHRELIIELTSWIT